MIRFKAWLVTGAPARGGAFALDFVTAIYRGVTGRKGRDTVR